MLTTGSFPYVNRLFKELASSNLSNAAALCEFLEQQQNEKNVKSSTVETYIKRLCWLSQFTKNKSWKVMTRDDVQGYLLSHKKSEEEDPRHKWIGSFNSWLSLYIGFFRWMHNHDKNRDDWKTPECVQIKRLKRAEESTYTPEQIWTIEDNEIFLRYVPHRMFSAFHAMTVDMSARPAELLSCNIEDIKFKVSSTGKNYAFVEIRQSKTRTRTLPLIVSVPYIKSWLNEHPLRTNPKAPLFISLRADTFGKRIRRWSVYNQFRRYQTLIFPRLLEDATVPEADKARIRYLLTKPWNPYLAGRHSSLTEISKHLSDSLFRQHGGWSRRSKQPLTYVHYFSNQSALSLLEHAGIEPKKDGKQSVLQPIRCPNCRTEAEPAAKFCSNPSCRMPLTTEGFQQVREDEKKIIEEMVERKVQQIFAKVDVSKLK
jgi:site-specific recombinase XerD